MTATRRALLLSGSIGMGHDVQAQACATSLEAVGWSTQTVDVMRMPGKGIGAAGEAYFRALQAMPGAFDALHFAALRTGNRLALLMDAGARRALVPRLRASLGSSPPDLAISLFATGASAISRLAEEFPAMRHVVFCTDATPHRLWVHDNVDLYLVTSAVAEAAVRRFQPDARVHILPAAVRPAFYQPLPQADARARLDVPLTERCVLLMSGGWGLGPVAAAAEALAAAGVQVLAVAGHNASLERRLRTAAEREPRLHPFGFTDAVPELMAAADLVVTSAGSNTCVEARTVGRPLLLLDVIQGHGRDNVQHQLELGDAAVTSPGAQDVVRTAVAALDQVKPRPTGPTRSLAEWEDSFLSVLSR